MLDTNTMKNALISKDPTYTQEELDGMTPTQICKAYTDLVDTLRDNNEDWAWRKEHAISNNL